MARNITVTFADGSSHVYQNAPDDIAPDAVQARAEKEFGQTVTALDGGKSGGGSMAGAIKQGAGNLAAGFVRGAGSIGATLVAPYDMAMDYFDGNGSPTLSSLITGKKTITRNQQRREDMDSALKSLGAEPDSMLYQGGKLGGEIAGTAGVGTAIAAPLKAAGIAPRLTQALTTGGFKTGATLPATLSGRAADLGIRATGGAISGGASAGLVSPEDAETGAMIGGSLPVAAKAVGVIGQAIGRSVRGKPVAPEVSALAERAAQLGIDVPADRLANSKPLNAIAAGLNYVPFSGRAGTEAKMQSQLNRALSRTFGQDSDNVTMALRKAQSDLGGEFDRVLKTNTVKIDNQLRQDLIDHEQRVMAELPFSTGHHPSASGNIIKNQIDEILSKGATGEIEGQAAYNIKKTLDRIGQRNTPEAFYARDLKKALIGALDRSLGPQESAAFANTRKQYGNMLALENLAQNGAEGNVSIARIANMKNINNADLQELADISAQFLKPREGQHGAAQRAAAGLGVGSFAGLPALGGAIAAGRVTNSALNSNALKNAVLGRTMLSGGTNALLNALEQGGYRTAPVVGSQ